MCTPILAMTDHAQARHTGRARRVDAKRHWRDECSHRRVRSRGRRVHHQYGVRGREHGLDGAVHHDPRLQDRQRETNHRRRPVVPLRAPRQKGQESRTDHGKIGGEHAPKIGMRPSHREWLRRESLFFFLVCIVC